MKVILTIVENTPIIILFVLFNVWIEDDFSMDIVYT